MRCGDVEIVIAYPIENTKITKWFKYLHLLLGVREKKKVKSLTNVLASSPAKPVFSNATAIPNDAAIITINNKLEAAAASSKVIHPVISIRKAATREAVSRLVSCCGVEL